MPARTGAALAVAIAVATSGCVSLDPAHVPERLVQGPGGNGWVEDASNENGSAFAKSATASYHDPGGSGRGYPAFLSILSFKSLVAPDPDELMERAHAYLRDQSESQGWTVQSESPPGTREVAGGRPSEYFVFTAKASSSNGPFTTGSTIKVLGEVFRCTSGASVIVSATAQVSSVRTIGGIPIDSSPDDRNWAELVADPGGSVDGKRGSQGLIYNVEC